MFFCRSSSSAEAAFNQLLLPAPSTSNGSAPPVKVDPKWDLLSGEEYNSPKADNSLALVPVEQQPASPVSQQNALVPFDMFSNGNNVLTPVNTQPIAPQFQQQTIISQGAFYPNGSMPIVGSPRYEQSLYTQNIGPAWNGQVVQQQQQQPPSPVYGALNASF